jgi:predicted component of type VI protein secretion system
MAARLVSLDGQPDILLAGGAVVVGRSRWCDVRIASARVSRRHCCLVLSGNEVLVRDLGSTNGTWINGRRVDKGALRSGDELQLAHCRYRLDRQDGPGSVPMAPRTGSFPVTPPDRGTVRRFDAAIPILWSKRVFTRGLST